ncbi:hypothetical protein GCM10020360_10820 [Nonlabens tegetincola]
MRIGPAADGRGPLPAPTGPVGGGDGRVPGGRLLVRGHMVTRGIFVVKGRFAQQPYWFAR